MKYICLIYSDRSRIDALPEGDQKAISNEYAAFTDSIRKSGHLVAGERLAPVQRARTIRSRNGHIAVTDGPFAETKEQLGGFYLIDARDLNEATEIASQIPGTRMGSIEVRPIIQPGA
jgi:hypothetical protein